MTASSESYSPPLDQLLKLGQPKGYAFSLDYASLGIGAEHIPGLLRMVTDDGLHNASGKSSLVWAPLHAWRALAQLKAEQAVGPLLGLLSRIDRHQDDWVNEDVPRALGDIGQAALEPVTAYLADSAYDDWARVAAAKALAEIGERHAELRTECAARLSAQLEKCAEQSETVNAFLVSPLLDLEAQEALPVMERAFAAGRVDESVVGDFEDVEIALGLKAARQHPPKPNKLTELGAQLRAIAAASEKADGMWDRLMDSGEPQPPLRKEKTGRNDPCPCGSGKKFKKCCGKA